MDSLQFEAERIAKLHDVPEVFVFVLDRDGTITTSCYPYGNATTKIIDKISSSVAGVVVGHVLEMAKAT